MQTSYHLGTINDYKGGGVGMDCKKCSGPKAGSIKQIGNQKSFKGGRGWPDK